MEKNGWVKYNRSTAIDEVQDQTLTMKRDKNTK